MPNSLSQLQGIAFAPNLTIHPGHWLRVTRPDGSVIRVRIMDFGFNSGTGLFTIANSIAQVSGTGVNNNPLLTQTQNYTDTFSIGLINAHGLTKQVLRWYNCYSFGNGVESNRITDVFNKQFLTPGVKVSTIFEDYKQEHRKYGLIYSGLYNSIGGINNLNQFIQAEKITKDINPTYGSIQKLHMRDTDLITLCEDKVLKILASKDAVYEADGNPQITSTNRVLGQTVPFVGEYGISKNPESFVSEAYRSYFTDKQRGSVMRLSKDGLTPISNHGMKDWFRDNLKLSNKLVGSYDDRNDEYNITLDNTATTPTTVSFREDVRGWVSFKSFVPENAISCANDYFTIKDGKIYKHYDESVDRNTFYDTYTDSSVNVILNDQPGSVKSFHTLDYEGSDSRVEGIRTVEVTGIQHASSSNDGKYFFFEELEMHSLLNRTDWYAIGPGWDPGNPEKAVEMKQYRNNVLIYSGLMMLWDNSNVNSTSSLSGGATKGHGRRTDANGIVSGNPGDFKVGDIITTEIQEKTVNHFNSMPKDGWYVSNIETDKQEGNLSEFIEKEGKWFNYIKGIDSDVSSTTDFGAFDIQGIGVIDSVSGNDIIFSNNINSSLQIGDTLYSETISEVLGDNIVDMENEETVMSPSYAVVGVGFDVVSTDTVDWDNNGVAAVQHLFKDIMLDDDIIEGRTYRLRLDVTGYTGTNDVGVVNSAGVGGNARRDSDGTTEIDFVSNGDPIDLFGWDTNSATMRVLVREITTGSSLGFDRLESDQLQKCGVVTSLTNNTITVDDSGTLPSARDYIMFAKNHAVNTSSLSGYYADVKFKNNSIEKAELFAASSEITESSK